MRALNKLQLPCAAVSPKLTCSVMYSRWLLDRYTKAVPADWLAVGLEAVTSGNVRTPCDAEHSSARTR